MILREHVRYTKHTWDTQNTRAIYRTYVGYTEHGHHTTYSHVGVEIR